MKNIGLLIMITSCSTSQLNKGTGWLCLMRDPRPTYSTKCQCQRHTASLTQSFLIQKSGPESYQPRILNQNIIWRRSEAISARTGLTLSACVLQPTSQVTRAPGGEGAIGDDNIHHLVLIGGRGHVSGRGCWSSSGSADCLSFHKSG